MYVELILKACLGDGNGRLCRVRRWMGRDGHDRTGLVAPTHHLPHKVGRLEKCVVLGKKEGVCSYIQASAVEKKKASTWHHMAYRGW